MLPRVTLVGLTIMYSFISSEILGWSLVMYACMYVLYPLNQAFVKLIHGELVSLPLNRLGVIQEGAP